MLNFLKGGTIVGITQVLSPAFIFDENAVQKALNVLKKIKEETNCKILFAVKSCGLRQLLEMAGKFLDGFAVSSPFEVLWTKEIAQAHHQLHLTTPALDPRYVDIVLSVASHISFNSINQYLKYAPLKEIYHFSPQIRINPLLSFVKNGRYDPCLPGSKLGVPLPDFLDHYDCFDGLQGIHLHTNCDCMDLAPLLQLVKHLDKHIPDCLKQIEEINLGGGYIFTSTTDLTSLYEAIQLLQQKYGLMVTLEPGASLSRPAAALHVKVLDIFQNQGVNVAIIDGSVNCLPEVFEYQYKHSMLEEAIDGEYLYTICGMTCLAGDQFGCYRFDQPLQVGDHLTFTDCGCYSLVKSHMFNGVNLPTVYWRDAKGVMTLIKEHHYSDWKMRWLDTEPRSV